MSRPARNPFGSSLNAVVAAPLEAQFGALGLSGVGAHRLQNRIVLPTYVPEEHGLFASALAAGEFNGDGFDAGSTEFWSVRFPWRNGGRRHG